MGRIYCDEVCNPKTEEATEFLLKIYNHAMTAQECLDEDNYKAWVLIFYNFVREKLNMPNKVFSIVKSKDNTQAQIVLFPKEPDGNYYEIGFDEELKLPYILVDNIKE